MKTARGTTLIEHGQLVDGTGAAAVRDALSRALMHGDTVMRSAIRMVLVLTLLSMPARGSTEAPEEGFRSPEGDARFTQQPGLRPLNNLVFELLNVESPRSIPHNFRNPRDGWVYIRIPSSAPAAGATVVLDGQQVPLRPVGEHLEAMRYLSEGSHEIVAAADGRPLQRLEVRAIGELFYAAYGGSPHVTELGNYTWEFLRKHSLDSFNSMIGGNALAADGKSTQEAEIKEWTDQGKRWFTLHPAQDHVRSTTPTQSGEQAYEYWANTLGMQHPRMSGISADEFGGSYQGKYYPYWVEGLRRLHANPRFNGRKFYAYGPSRFWPLEDGYEVMFPFVKTLMECGYGYGPEWYQVEGRSRPGRTISKTEDLRAELGPEWEMASRKSFEHAATGLATNRIVVLSVLAEPGHENSDLYADCDYNVFLDYQFHFLATEPAFFGIRGVQQYLSSYCPEEQLRLFARLVRHYFIEGHTERMLKDPYVLAHLENADFVNGTKGWTLDAAVTAPGQVSIAAKTVPGLGTLQAKYHAPQGTGDAAIWTRRSAAKPNVISQQIRNLEPGRLYSLHFFTSDYQEFVNGKSVHRKHAATAQVDNVELVTDKCFQAVIDAGYWYPFGPFNRENRYCLNYHQQVFRARERATKLSLSDWVSASVAGGPEGEELLWNYIQVQPYFE